MTDHQQQLDTISRRVREFFEAKRPFRIYHGSTNSTRVLTFKRDETIDVSQLNHVLQIDAAKRTAWVEPNVPMDQLVKATLRHGLIPKVVPEFPGITVGGSIQGGAGESSSFRYGCFSQICTRYEMILADGSTTTASRKKHSDLFYGTAGSFGTLGIITAAEVQLLPAKRYVQLTYLPVNSFESATTTLKHVVGGSYDFIDGTMFSRSSGVIIVGRLSDGVTGPVQRFGRAHDPWYYLHVAKISARAAEYCETVPLVDYLFRYDRGAFWVGKYAFELFHIPFVSLTRWLLNPLLHTRKLYQALQASGTSQQFIVQDLALPYNTAVPFLTFVDEHLGIYPLWLCPLIPDSHSPLQFNNLATELCINVGVWGKRMTSRAAFLTANRAIEHTLGDFGGKKWFYAHSYYTKREFWSRYDKRSYDRLRRKYHAETLPTIFDKIRVHDVHAVRVTWGALCTLLGLARLRINK